MAYGRAWRRIHGLLRHAVFGVSAMSLVAQPLLAAPHFVPRPVSAAQDQLATYSLQYLDSISQGLRVGAGAIPLLQAIETTTREQVSDQAVEQAQEQLLEVADRAAVALGSVDEILEAVEVLGVSGLPAADLGQGVADGLPQGLRDSLLADLDLSPSQLDLIDATFRDALRSRQEVGASGLSDDVIALLREGGATQAQIDEIDAEVRSRGYADAGLSTRAEQLRASQDELAGLRLGANAANVRLIEIQVQARQARGIAPRAVTGPELQELAEDELRLLLHVAHLQELWGDDPSLEVGEGDWWFVERYATRATERLTDLIVDSQNLALDADLLILFEVRSLAVSARSGDADYVRSELDSLAAALAELGGDASFVARQREIVQGVPGKLLARLVTAEGLRERFSWPLAARDITAAGASIRQRVDRWEPVASDPSIPALADTNPSNDSLGALLVVGGTFPEVIRALKFLHGYLAAASLGSEFTISFIEVLVGLRDPSSIAEYAALVAVSFIPFLDLLNDVVTILRVDDPFVKALACFGLAMTLVELAVLIPPLAGFGVGAQLPDAFVTGVRAVYVGTDLPDFRGPLNLLTDEQGFEMAGDLVATAGVRMLDEGLPGDAAGVARILSAEFRSWDDFVAYVRAVGNRAEGVDLLVEMGLDEGSLLVGAVARHGDVGLELTVDQIRAVHRFGNDLIETGIRLSDEAAGGITRIISDAGGAGLERVVNGLRHADGGLQSEQVEQALVLVGRAAFTWTEESLEGIGRSARLIGASGTQRLFDLGESAREAFAAIAVRGPGIWDEATAEGLARLFQKDLLDDILRGSRQSDYYLEILRAYDDDTAEGVLRVLREGDPASASHILQRSSDPGDLFQWRSRGNSPDDLQDARTQFLRSNLTSAEYAELKQQILNRWNGGQEMPIKQLREAFGVEGPIWALQKQYPDRFEIVWVNTGQGGAGQGVDAVLWDLVVERWVIVEGKGTSQAVTELAGDMFPTPSLGRQLSLPWIVNKPERYLDQITNPATRARVQQMVINLQGGAAYDVLIGRGGIRPTRLDYGSKLSDFLAEIDSAKLALRRFVFVTSP